jgi:ATP-binding cassette subfamily F protein uup
VSILLNAAKLSHAFGARPLFEGVTFTLSEGDRVGLIGPNGAGKSTLLKILAGELAPDGGQLAKRGQLRVALLAQTPTFAEGHTVRQAVRTGLSGAHHEGGWEADARVDELLAKLQLNGPVADGDTPVAQLSGGWAKRVALARELVAEPELLLLDEPTNHLDVESILWLERHLAAARFATVTVTHDRHFLQRVATRILELDRQNAGGLLDVRGDYATYVDRKAEAMASQELRAQVLRNTLRRETEWLRRGPPARSTKQQARIQRAGELAKDVAELGTRNVTRKVDLDFQASGRKPKRLIEARSITKRYGDRTVFANVDLFLGPGSRVGLLGPNGCGKSTLLRTLIGDESPSQGTVLRADSLQVASFEQDRGSLDPHRSVADTICPGGDFVEFRDARLHRFGYLERFLFRQEQMVMSVGTLSGGEQARLLIARLMLRPANVLVLDEPTNDLDLATLGVLEEALTTFDGAVLLVSHDRYFLAQVATELVAFHTHPAELGRTTAFAGLEQWEEWLPTQTPTRLGRDRADGRAGATAGGEGAASVAGGGAPRRKKLSFKEQREWDAMETRIAEAEAKVAALLAESERPEVASDSGRVVALYAELETARAEVDQLYGRWAELETLQAG